MRLPLQQFHFMYCFTFTLYCTVIVARINYLSISIYLAGLPEQAVVAVVADTDDIGLDRASISLLAATGPLSVSLTLSGSLLGLGSPTAASICSNNNIIIITKLLMS